MINVEWLNQNALRAYPFQEDMQCIPHDDSGVLMPELKLPTCVIVDMTMSAACDKFPEVYLSKFTFVDNVVTFIFRDKESNDIFTSLTLDYDKHNTNDNYRIYGAGAWESARGWVVVGDLAKANTMLPQGSYAYSYDQTTLEATTIRPTIRGVSSISIDNNGEISRKYYGNVNFIAGSNIRLEADNLNNGIWISADPSAGYVEDCQCGHAVKENKVRTINGIAASNFNITGGPGVTVTTSGNVIKILNPDATPCCGCPELDFITQTNKLLESSIATLEMYANTLQAKLDMFSVSFSALLGVS